MDFDEKEHKWYDLAIAKLQRASNKWDGDKMKRLDFINTTLHEINK